MSIESDDSDRTRIIFTPTVGSTVDHYRIIDKIGEGGMGEVFLAEDTELKRRVALKFLPAQFIGDEDLKFRFKREAQAAAALAHPNIVTIYGVSEFRGRPYFAMEHIGGNSLRDVLKGQELRIEQVIDIAIQIAEGLNKAHQHGVIHRDIKPANIVIDTEGRAKLVDFGLAAIQGGEQITKIGSTLGTVAYMSPEQAMGREVDQRSDVFSFGIVLYEMISGKAPFKAENDIAVTNAILTANPEPLARYKANISPGLQEIINKALDKDLETRYPSVASMLADLKRERRLLDPATGSHVSVASSSSLPKRRIISRLLIPGSIAVLLLLIVLILKPWRLELKPDQQAVAGQNWLAVMYFDNLADPTDSKRYGEIVTNLLITDLSESQYIKVVSSQRLYDILKALGKEGTKKIDKETASQIAARANAKWMLTGTILQEDPEFIITFQLIDVASGGIVGTQRVTGNVGEKIFTLVDKMHLDLRKDLALPQVAQTDSDKPVTDVTTNSQDAYRYYVEGQNYAQKFYGRDAYKSFLKAIEYDSTFAMGYFWVAYFADNYVERKRFAKLSAKYSGHSSWKDKLLISSLLAEVDGDLNAAASELRKIIARDPTDKQATYALAQGYYTKTTFLDSAVKYYNRVIELDSLDKLAYNGLSYAYSDKGDFEKSLWAINQYILLAPDEANPYDSRADLYAMSGDLDKAIQSYKKAHDIKPDFYVSYEKLGIALVMKRDFEGGAKIFGEMTTSSDKFVASEGKFALAEMAVYQGKLKRALQLFDEGISEDLKNNLLVSAAKKMGTKSKILGLGQGNYAEALAVTERLLGILKANGIDQQDATIWLVGSKCYFWARLGQAKESDQQMSILKDICAKDSSNNYIRYFVQGLVQLANNQLDQATATLEQSYASKKIFMTAALLGKAYLDAGKSAQAISILEKSLARFDSDRYGSDIINVKAYYYLASAYDKSGWKSKAVDAYTTFLAIWNDADPGFKEIDDAKARLAALKTSS